jgi:hypothetical protein
MKPYKTANGRVFFAVKSLYESIINYFEDKYFVSFV